VDNIYPGRRAGTRSRSAAS